MYDHILIIFGLLLELRRPDLVPDLVYALRLTWERLDMSLTEAEGDSALPGPRISAPSREQVQSGGTLSITSVWVDDAFAARNPGAVADV